MIVPRAAILVLVAASFAATSAHAEPSLRSEDSGCSVPCGPIPVYINFVIDPTKKLEFPADGVYADEGKLQYGWSISNDGWAVDPSKDVVVSLAMKQPGWIETMVEPATFKIPVKPGECPQCVKADPQTQVVDFLYEAPFKVTIKKVREPSPAELLKATRTDGQYRVQVSGEAPESRVPGPGGTTVGLDPGYGFMLFKFISPPDMLAEARAASSQGASSDAAASPGVGAFALLAALGAAAAAAGRRY